MSDKNLTVFVDNIGRTVLGEVVSDTETELVVKQPAILHVVPNQQTGQISVQLLPFFFKEFATSEAKDVTWTFLKQHLTISNGLKLDGKIISQYDNMYSPIVNPNTAPVDGGDTKVVKLFDD